MNGVLLLNKPAGPTSHDMVDFIRRLSDTRRVGHAGTLDPFATGLLVLLIGQATRISQFLTNLDKKYLATIALGESTDTLDRTGKVVETSAIPLPGRAEIETVLQSFVGESEQIPPMYSAKKINGRPLYRAARRGEEVNREAKTVRVHSIELIEVSKSTFTVRVCCSKGTYVRVLAEAIARRLGGCGHLADLQRESSGRFQLHDAVTPEQAETSARDGKFAELLLPIGSALADLPAVTVAEQTAKGLRNGIRPPTFGLTAHDAFRRGQTVRMLDPESRLLAIARALLDAEQLARQPGSAAPFELLSVFEPPSSDK